MHVLFLPSLPHRSSYVASLIHGSPLVTWTTDNHQQPSYSALLDVGCLLCWLHDRHDNFTARRCFSFDINSVTSLTSLSSLCRLCRFLLLVEICHIFSGICGLVWLGQFAPFKFGILWKTCDPKLHLPHFSVAPAKLLPHRTRGGSEPIAMKFSPWCLRSTCFIQISKELYYMYYMYYICYLWNRLKLMTSIT